MMKPEPTPRGTSASCCWCGACLRLRGAGCCWRGGIGTPKKRRKYSCIPSSSPPGTPFWSARTLSVVRMFTTAGPTLSTKSVKSGRPATVAAEAGRDRVRNAEVKRAPDALRINAVIVFFATWIVFMGSLSSRLELDRIGDLSNCHGRNFTYDSKPKISLTLADDVHRPLLQ